MRADEGRLAGLKVRVEFGAGQVEMTAGAVERLSPGTLIPTSLVESEFLDISVNGRSIGAGELVKVGDRLAVRVTRLYQND